MIRTRARTREGRCDRLDEAGGQGYHRTGEFESVPASHFTRRDTRDQQEGLAISSPLSLPPHTEDTLTAHAS